MSYFTVKDETKAEFEEKKSLFIGHVKRVETEEEAKEFVNKIKSQHKEATHNVYAYIVGENMGIQRYSDDGEPQGTGGIPVLEVLKKSGITDVAVVVTRYFGGILLGAGGLVRAYSKGASLAVKDAGVVEKVKGLLLEINIEYDLLGKIQYLCGQKEWHIEDIEYTDRVNIKMFTEASMVETISNQMTEVTSGKAVISTGDVEFYFKLEKRLYPIMNQDNKVQL